MLFDVQENPQKLIDLADTHPHIAKKLAEMLESETRNHQLEDYVGKNTGGFFYE